MRYLRFVIAERHPDTGVERGIFKPAYDLLVGHDLSVADRELLDSLVKWNEKNLPVPERFNLSKSKGFQRRKTRGVSWLKPTAQEPISRLRQIAGILARYGHEPRMIETDRPGYVVYEDDCQIVAEPFRESYEACETSRRPKRQSGRTSRIIMISASD